MLNIKFFAVVLTALALTGCDSSKQNEIKQSASAAIESCKHLKIDQLIGFDEQAETPQCKSVNEFNLVAFKCEVSKHAFGVANDAAHIENEAHSIFAYTSEAACRQGLEAHDGNGP